MEKFKSFIPAELVKGEKNEWRIRGLASTKTRDLQGEIVDVDGLNLSVLEKRAGVFNWDHGKGPENTVGVIDSVQRKNGQLHLGGYLFQKHDKAKSIYQVMESLKEQDRGRMGLSVEGIIHERDGKIIKKATLTACALTLSPVNTDTYVDLAKSLGATAELDSTIGYLEVAPDLEKALSVGGEYATTPPSELSGGAALAQEDLDRKKKKNEELEKMCKCGHMMKSCQCPKEEGVPKTMGATEMYKSMLSELLQKISVLYPNVPKAQLWETIKDRMNTKFPDLNLE